MLKTVTLFGMTNSYIFENPGIYNVILNVTDFIGFWDSDSIIVTVLDITNPVANAGNDITIDQGTTVSLDGTESYDNVEIVNATWSGQGIPTIYGLVSNHTFSDPGIFVINLTVRDARFNQDKDSLNITVLDAEDPIAEAGSDLEIDQHTKVIFDGSGSYDRVGITNYTWVIVEASGNLTLYGLEVDHVFDEVGSLLVTLTVRDGSGMTGEDSLFVRVRDTTDPVAMIDTSWDIDEDSIATFEGSSSLDNVGIVNFTWTIDVSGEKMKFYGEIISHTFENPGEFRISLEVFDARNNSDLAEGTIRVKDITPPIVNVGEDITIDIGNTVTFKVKESYDNVKITNYTWTFKIGTETIILYGEKESYTFNVPGTFEVRLTAKDNEGNVGIDSLNVTVTDNEKTNGQKNRSDINIFLIIIPILLILVAIILIIIVKKKKNKIDIEE
jgi:hypothetical protein